MIGNNWNFYVKKMQKFVRMLFGILWLVVLLSGCTKKEEALMLLSLEEVEEAAGEETEATEGENGEIYATEAAGIEVAGIEAAEADFLRESADEVQVQTICVHVCGAVRSPGVYELMRGSRVYEAVEAAGGFTEDADADYINQAQMLEDAVKIVIPTVQEVEALETGEQAENAYGVLSQDALSGKTQTESLENEQKGLVNINTASRAELMNLPGIGEAKAEAIVAYRDKIGVFTSTEQIMEIDGIKSGLYSKIQDKICVE